MELYTQCAYCEKIVVGRPNKKFCNSYCRSAFHNDKVRKSPPTFFKTVDNQLKRNRKILRRYNRSGKSTVRSKVLHDEGFNEHFFTHYWKNPSGDVYFFCYEYGFKKIKSQGYDRLLLVNHQEYMLP